MISIGKMKEKFDKNKYGDKMGIELIKNIISDKKSIFADGYFILKLYLMLQ